MSGNTGSGVWADAACRSTGIETLLKAKGLTRHIHRKGRRGKPLTGQARKSIQAKSCMRVRVDHVFGAQANTMGGPILRTTGILRTKARIGMKTLACNTRRRVQLRRLDPRPA
jgi:IS5 family transposase